MINTIALYGSGRVVGGWVCADCDARYRHAGKPLLTFLRLLDHVVLDHHRWLRRLQLVIAAPPKTSMSVGEASYTVRMNVVWPTDQPTLTIPNTTVWRPVPWDDRGRNG